jgi:hypothetical protein
MIWVVVFLVLVVLFVGTNLFFWYEDLKKERDSPFKFDEGEVVLRRPAFEFQVHLMVLSDTFWRYTIIKRRRNWLGRKLYETQYHGVHYPIVFRERELARNI